MIEKFKGKYRIASARLSGYDYGKPGWYFVTICSQNRLCYFGEIVNNKMILSTAGKIVAEEISNTKQIRNNVKIDAWVIMPNHVHLIVIILDNNNTVETHCNASGGNTSGNDIKTNIVETHCNASGNDIKTRIVETHCNASLPTTYQNKFGPQKNNLSSIIRGFKGVVTKRIHLETNEWQFSWQERFHEHVIKNEKSLYNIRDYVRTNPAKWGKDTFFSN